MHDAKGMYNQFEPRTEFRKSKIQKPDPDAGITHPMNSFRHYQVRLTEEMAFTSPDINKEGILIPNVNEVRSLKKR
jgi:hypothetical protein